MGYFLIAAAISGFPYWQVPPRVRPKMPPPQVAIVQPKMALQPGQACAIPLLNVLRKNWGKDDMVAHTPPTQAFVKDSMPVVAPPAPSCDDVK